MIAAGWALAGPQLVYVLEPWVGGRTLNTAGHADGIVALLFTGGYPAMTWVPFVIAGMAVARLDLAGAAARIRLALTGVALAAAGYGGSWLALRIVPGAADVVREHRPQVPPVTPRTLTCPARRRRWPGWTPSCPI